MRPGRLRGRQVLSDSDGLRTIRTVLDVHPRLCGRAYQSPCRVPLLLFLLLAPPLERGPTSGAWDPLQPAQCLAHNTHSRVLTECITASQAVFAMANNPKKLLEH